MTRSKLKRWIPVIIVVAIVGAIFGYLGYNAIPLTKEHMIGTWHAVDGETGTATFNADGTFELRDMSFNPAAGRPANDTFYATGTWEIGARGGQQTMLELTFADYEERPGFAAQGEEINGMTIHTVVRNWQRALYFSDGEEVHTLVMVKD